MKQKLYACSHCKNIIAMLRDNGPAVYCCNEKMHELTPDSTDASAEKHKPIYTLKGNIVCVEAGKAHHPMTAEHYIEWICLETERGIQYVHLTPNDAPKAEFALCEGDRVKAVYTLCNQHELWRD